MVMVAIQTLNGKADEKVSKIADRLRSENLLKNPFSARTARLPEGLWLFSITPVYPNVGLFAVFPAFLWLFFPYSFFGYVGLCISFVMLFINLWWYPRFYYLLFSIVTRKGVSYVPLHKFLERVVRWDSKRS